MPGARRLSAAVSIAASVLTGGCQSGGGAPAAAAAPATPTAASTPRPEPTPRQPPAARVPGQPAPGEAGEERPYRKILRLAQGGASTETLLSTVRADGVRYDLTTPEILELRRAGVAEEVVEAMLRSGHS